QFDRPVEVIPCCVDLEKFKTANEFSRREVQAQLEIGGRRVIAYVGSFGGWYLTDEMLDFFKAARDEDPNTFFLILTQRDKEMVHDALIARGFAERDFFAGGVTPGEIPRYLSAADVAISFIKACYSKLSSSPTKIPEYLACGVPVIANSGVGDIDELVEKNGVGVLLDDFSPEAYLSAIKVVKELGGVDNKCRETARREFDLENVGGDRYRRMYRELISHEETE
ncbi:MAG: glycosyltransferase, partial [Pyrinomonadaceae bacterium]